MAVFRSTSDIVVSVDEVTGVETFEKAFSYGTNVVDNGNGYEGAYVIHDGEMMGLGGVVKTTAALSAGATIIKLGSSIAPAALEQIQVVVNSTTIINAEVAPDGRVITKQSIGINGVISLNGVKFLHKDAFIVADEPMEIPTEEEIQESLSGRITYNVTPQNGFTVYGGGYGGATSTYRLDGSVIMQGLLKVPTTVPPANTVIGKLEDGAYLTPEFTLPFDVRTGGGTVRVDVKPNGDIVFVEGTPKTYINLAQIVYNTEYTG